jgi:hypothetical protein
MTAFLLLPKVVYQTPENPGHFLPAPVVGGQKPVKPYKAESSHASTLLHKDFLSGLTGEERYEEKV